MRMLKSVIAFYILIFPLFGVAKIKLPSVLADHMVLQQHSEVKFWGESKPNAVVTIFTSWNNRTYHVTANAKGKWLKTAVVTTAAGGPYQVTISDGEKLVLNNILLGEVWFCSGQSNMEMPIEGFFQQPVDGSNDVIVKAKLKLPIRIFSTDSQVYGGPKQFSKEPQLDCIGQWQLNLPQHVARTSATAYFFAQYLQEVLDVPVGIIVSSWGGSNVEAWMSKEAIAPFNLNLDHLLPSGNIATPIQQQPCVLFNAKINPFLNYTVKGILWYQGESNIHEPDRYAKMLPAFVQDLRTRWKLGSIPFYYVQIAPYQYKGQPLTAAARMREVQLFHMREVPNSGMVTTLDIGDSTFIHPIKKREVGNRLAYWALAKTYGRTGFGYCAPLYKEMTIENGNVYLTFDQAPRGIAPMWRNLEYFEIAGNDRKFFPAKAFIDPKTLKLTVSSNEVAHPKAVRYAYHNFTGASLFDVYGLPVSSFRTDNW